MGYSGKTGRILAELAATQSGVFSLRQAVKAGLDHSLVISRSRAENLFRVYRGSYSLTRRVSREGIWMAGCLSAGEETVLSHMSAAHLWEIVTRSGPTEVLRVKSAGHGTNSDAKWGGRNKLALTEHGRRIPVLKIRSTRNLHPAEVTVLRGIPVTTVARMFVDICGSVGKGQLKSLLHEAARNGLLRFDELRAAMDRARGKKGVARLREIIDDWDPQTAWTRNEMEQEVKELLRKSDQPEPLVNRMVGGHEVDFFYPDCGLIIQADGAQDHNAPHGIERDKDLDSELQLKGFRTLRLTRTMIRREPAASMRKVREHRELCLAEGRRADPGWATASIGHRLRDRG